MSTTTTLTATASPVPTEEAIAGHAEPMKVMRMGNPVLRRRAAQWARAEVLTNEGHTRPEVMDLVRAMVATMRATRGIGLAAPQVGVSKQLVVVHLPADPNLPKLQGPDALPTFP